MDLLREGRRVFEEIIEIISKAEEDKQEAISRLRAVFITENVLSSTSNTLEWLLRLTEQAGKGINLRQARLELLKAFSDVTERYDLRDIFAVTLALLVLSDVILLYWVSSRDEILNAVRTLTGVDSHEG